MKLTIATIGMIIALQVSGMCQQTNAIAAGDEAIHQELRALRAGLVEAVNSQDIEKVLTYLHPNVVVTWQNAEVSRGREGVRNYLSRMLKGPKPVVQKYTTDIKVDELSALYMNSAIAWGVNHDYFALSEGLSFNLKGRWSAVMIRENEGWLISAIHSSTNIFDNPLLNNAKRLAITGSLIAFLVGIAGTWFLTRRKNQKSPPPTS